MSMDDPGWDYPPAKQGDEPQQPGAEGGAPPPWGPTLGSQETQAAPPAGQAPPSGQAPPAWGAAPGPPGQQAPGQAPPGWRAAPGAPGQQQPGWGPGGAAGPPPGAGTPTPSPGPPSGKGRTTKMLLGGGAAVVIIVLVVLIVVFASSGSGGKHPSPTTVAAGDSTKATSTTTSGGGSSNGSQGTTGGSGAEPALLGVVPSAFSGQCSNLPAAQRGPGSIDEVVCQTSQVQGASADFVLYSRFASTASLGTQYQDLLSSNGVESGQGDCSQVSLTGSAPKGAFCETSYSDESGGPGGQEMIFVGSDFQLGASPASQLCQAAGGNGATGVTVLVSTSSGDRSASVVLACSSSGSFAGGIHQNFTSGYYGLND
jgi:hypothetical protein